MPLNPLVTAAWLQEHLTDPDVRVVDCRYVLGRPGAGRMAYLERHIAGASYLDLDEDLAAPVGDGRDGRHPLPDPEAFAAAARRAGISRDTSVVAYDGSMTGGAARLWWLLRHFGHDRVSVLDGGFAGWEGPVRAGEEPGESGDFEVAQIRDDLVTAEQIQAGAGGLLLDARAPERFRGEVEPIDAVAGHIPGARNVPFTGPVPDEVIAEDSELTAYCGSGVTAAVVLLKLAAAGRDEAKLYPGSWSEWSTRGLPVETGD